MGPRCCVTDAQGICSPMAPHPPCSSLALTIVQGVHSGILHSLLAQLDPHYSLHLLEQAQGTN